MRSAAGLALYILSLADGLLALPSPSGDVKSTGAVATGMPVARPQLLARKLLPEQARATPAPTHHVQLPRSARRLRQLGERQDPEPETEAASETTSNDLTLFGTRTAEDGGVDTRTQTAADITDDPAEEENTTGPVPTPTTSVSHEWITTSVLTPQSSAVPLAATMGLIMPNPWQSIYVEQEYRLGFIDPVAKPAPTVGGWMRQVTPLLIVPGNHVNTFNMTGPRDPSDPVAIPPQSDGLCGARIEDDAVRYPFVFHTPGWYMLVINQTWYQPTVTDNICALPYITQNTFFATHLLSVAALPTSGPMPAAPPPPHTVFAEVTVETPGRLPIDPGVMDRSMQLGVGLGATFGVLALLAVIGMLYWANRRNKRQREEEVFSRMKPHEQQAFILENPTHFLNPHRAEYLRAQRGMYRGTDMFGQPRPWWSRWGQGTGMADPYGFGGGYGNAGAYAGHPHGSVGMGGYGQVRQAMPGSQPAYAAATNPIDTPRQGRQKPSGWKRLFSRDGGLGTQQAYLQQLQEYLEASHQQQQHHRHESGQGHEYGKEAGYGYPQGYQGQAGYGEFGQPQLDPQYPQGHVQADTRQVYQVPVQSQMVYQIAQRWQ